MCIINTALDSSSSGMIPVQLALTRINVAEDDDVIGIERVSPELGM